MSYCRWSSDDFACDVYCYESRDGYTTHVADSRHVCDEEMPPPMRLTSETAAAWFERHKQVMDIVGRARLEPIGGPHDGESFTDPTPGAAADRLEELRGSGYNVPQYAIDLLREEREWKDDENGQ